MTNTNKKIELVFPRPKGEMNAYLPKANGEEFPEMQRDNKGEM